MGKVLAILVAGLASAAGAGYAFFHFADPYRCDPASCDTAAMKCCATPTAASPAAAPVAAAGPVALFATVPVSADVHDCCAALAAPVSARVTVKAPCCGTGAACCSTLEPCCPALAAAVGPAAAR
jgi:hypothetical protein